MNKRGVVGAAILWIAMTALFWFAASPQRGNGMTWDEAYYYPTFVDVGEWTKQLLHDPAAALSDDGIRTGWERIHELPPVVKWFGAAAHLIGNALGMTEGWQPLHAIRLMPAAAFTTTLFLMVAIGIRMGWGAAGLAAAILYMAMPRIVGHARIAATETVFVCVMALVIYCALGNLNRWRNVVLLMAALGLALATKVNGIILLATVIAWLLLRASFAQGRPTLPKPFEWRAAALSLFLSPVVAFALWPWMWHHPIERLAEYGRFITEHPSQGLWYLGEKWNFGGPPAPMSYPVVIAHLVTPILVLAVFWAGMVLLAIRAFRKKRINPRILLLAMAMLAPLAAASLPSTPRYDGERLFLPMFFPAALLVGSATIPFSRRFRIYGRKDASRFRHPALSAWGEPAVLVLVLIIAVSGHSSLDGYNAAGKLLGGRDFPFAFEQTYWGNAFNPEAMAGIEKIIPKGAAIKTLATQTEMFPILQGWGATSHFTNIDGPPPYDFHILQNRKGFWGNAEWWLVTSRHPIATFGSGINGEPLIYVFDGRPPGE